MGGGSIGCELKIDASFGCRRRTALTLTNSAITDLQLSVIVNNGLHGDSLRERERLEAVSPMDLFMELFKRTDAVSSNVTLLVNSRIKLRLL